MPLRACLPLAAFALLGLACSGPQQPGETQQDPPEAAQGSAEQIPDATLQRARGAADALGAELMSKLATEMQTGGPAQAVRVCSEVAQQIAASHSTEDLSVRRVSLKVRNPADRPDEFERRQLERLHKLHDEGALPQEIMEVVEDKGRPALRYLRPILVGELCLRCHGETDSLDPQVRSLIEQRYPEDQAVGYDVGDLRGAVSVHVRLD